MKRSVSLPRKSSLLRKGRLRPVAKSKHWKKALDDLARKVVFARDGNQCVRCGKKEGIQWCHVDSRRYLSTRWLLENSMALCAGHHLAWHHRPLEAAEWFRTTYPERWNRLTVRAASAQKFDRKLERLYLEAEARKLGVEP